MNGWGWLLVAGAFEIAFTTFLKLSQADSRYGVAFLVSVILSFECLSRAIKTLPLSTAYAIWTGIGAVGTVLMGVTVFGETLAPVQLLLLGLLIAVLIGLKLATPKAAGPS
ncbi:quaternary ammonium compound-resistance protein SugE [Deinococcus reticulitermitis]|uniref:Quaternary ammonium compound-resistance protein SugE n=1 Tax=Deinococcus reticulitermitis TaxID=856736 RepID=A0A1H6VIZ1_9DEIO|nr:multidrug efflux SMR transporter [Deinococcus reticulitermitis]SEJ04543.1 quaternary ammonium compound-resistance protein SugE [Deinococcus reticulitermitis]